MDLASLLKGINPSPAPGNLPFPRPGIAPPQQPSNDAMALALAGPQPLPGMSNEIPSLPKLKPKQDTIVGALVRKHFAKQASRSPPRLMGY